ncbi:TetR/AcrR family transcriptional regulator [Actinokineospora iranica]|uniref:DNA-binding transcriptional regulator, AcrR family n=1 Tax=Actinokineospora iranica TaxID=1271860 RepID=A0A1G6JGQ2_9PSEU|nr:TetR/AcrR family transcriptional regulator [Actinokineospora iranica]SDC17910.1 DNA-binding transcriptional regulator, AcrR family [Actinokineospora iranica]
MTEPPAERGAYHHGALRAALTEAALDMLDEGGLARVTVREVARRVGVSPGAPFRHFADRQALLTAVAERVLADFGDWQRAAVAGTDHSAFYAFGLAFVRYAATYPHRFELLRSAVYGRELPEALRPGMAQVGDLATELIVAGQRAGELRPGDPDMVRLAAHALVYGLSQMIVDGFLPAENAERLVEGALTIFGQGIKGTSD